MAQEKKDRQFSDKNDGIIRTFIQGTFVILAACITAAAGIYAAYVSRVSNSIQATSTAIAATSTQSILDTSQAPTPTPLPSQTPYPTKTFQPSETPAFTPTPVPLTEPGTILNNGETWYAKGWSLTVNNFTYKTLSEIQFILQNNTDRLVLWPDISDGVLVLSDAGDEFNCVFGIQIGQREIRPYEKVKWDVYFGRALNNFGCPGNKLSDPSPNARTLTLIVGNLSDVIIDAKWQAEIPRP